MGSFHVLGSAWIPASNEFNVNTPLYLSSFINLFQSRKFIPLPNLQVLQPLLLTFQWHFRKGLKSFVSF